MIIKEYVNTLINAKRYEIISVNEGLSDEYKELLEYFKQIYDGAKLSTILRFIKLYKKAKETNKEEDIKKAIEFYKSTIDKGIFVHKRIKEIYKELLKMYKPFEDKKKQDEYNKKWGFRNGKEVTIPEIESHLKVIIAKLKKDPKCIEYFKKYNAKLICVNLYSNTGDIYKYVEFQIISGDNYAYEYLDDYLYQIKDQLEKELPVSVDCITPDKEYEGRLYIYY